ncbi:MAG: P-loop NTPase [Candidatus Aenigmatarchaeota archaeon]
MPESIALVSGKGGTGKSVTALNLGLAFQKLGEKTILIDGDRTSPDISVLLGLNPNQDFTLQEVLENEENPLKSITMHDSGLMVLPSSFVAGENKINEENFDRILNLLDNQVIIDCPPGVYEDILSIIKLVDKIIFVTNPEIPAIVDSLRLFEEIEKMGEREKVEGVILNKVENDKNEVTKREVEFLFRLPVITNIRRDKSFKESIQTQKPLLDLYPYSENTIKYKRLASHFSKRPFDPPKFRRARKFLRKIGLSD